MKETAQRIFRETLAAIDIRETCASKLEPRRTVHYVEAQQIDLREFREILAIAYGKAALAMAEGLDADSPPDTRARGILVDSVAASLAVRRVGRFFVAGHPIPNEQSFAAGRAILESAEAARREVALIVIFLLSGGGSSLVEMPLDTAAFHSPIFRAPPRAGHLRRAHRRDQRDPQASFGHKRRAPGAGCARAR